MVKFKPTKVELESITSLLFYHERTQKAAGVLLNKLRTSKRLTQPEMHELAKKLDSGELGVKIRRTNFYRGVLGPLVNLGFVGRSSVVGPRRRQIKAYAPILQPVSSRAPDNPSFIYVAWLMGHKWNEFMFPGTGKILE